MTSTTATKITAQNIKAGMTIQVAGIDSNGWVQIGAFRKSSPVVTVAAVEPLEQDYYNSNKLQVTTTDGQVLVITTRQKVALIG